VLAGGAEMFARSRVAGFALGVRNEAAVREALAEVGIPVRAAATGGNCGRTVRVLVGEARVTVKEAGGEEVELWHARPAADDPGETR
jgi:chemotaxis receptor (MCP) glutamine deamidase CheD